MNKPVSLLSESEESLKEFLNLLKTEYRLDYSGYSSTFVSRRLGNLLDDLGLNNLEILFCLLRQRPEYLDIIQKKLSINYTEMFRDPGFFSSLRTKVFPYLSIYPKLNIWHAGCSTGEEVFSLAILLDEVGLLGRTKIFATDKNEEVLTKASAAIFDHSRIQEFTSNYYLSGGKRAFSNYYSSGYGQLKFEEKLRRSICFRKHNLVTDEAFKKFNLVLCRNVMIYFNHGLQDKVVGTLSESLTNFGYLGLGSTETLSYNMHRHEYSAIDSQEKIYRKVSLSEWKNCKN